ncbi:MAG: Y4yA family PLP-dependent enzyme [Pirellulaceae bacterium]
MLDITNALRSHCAGTIALPGRMEDWMEHVLANEDLAEWIRCYESPLNVLNTQPLQRNIRRLDAVAHDFDLDFRVFFARKANKCLNFIDAANAINAGIDTAGQAELLQTLDRGVDPQRIICTAAVKDDALLHLCIMHGVVIAIDNDDEWRAVRRLAETMEQAPRLALRLSGFRFENTKLPSRFGIDVDDVFSFLERNRRSDETLLSSETAVMRIEGLHFHLDGYCHKQRVAAIQECLQLTDGLRQRGHAVAFLDIGGGFPMRYVDDVESWETFQREHERALLNEREPITYRNHGLGRMAVNGHVYGSMNVYPSYQSPVASDWLTTVLGSAFESSTIAEALRKRGLQLRCEPGRSVLDGCGMTIARVVFRKRHREGHWLIGLSMNRTQCRTTHDDFLVDPIVVHAGGSAVVDRPAIEGYLVGAYCTESELLSLRRLTFPNGIAPGDLVVFVNTAGYLMHFKESRSHQFPLAKNVFVDEKTWNRPTLDAFSGPTIELS